VAAGVSEEVEPRSQRRGRESVTERKEEPPMRKIARDLVIVAGGHVIAYVVIFWTMPVSAHLTA
jgi:cell division septal protein FtsQ